MSLNLYTERYEKEVIQWILENNYTQMENASDFEKGFAIETVGSEDCVCDQIARLLERVLLSQNPVVNHNDALRTNVQNIVFAPCHQGIAQEIKEYLLNHQSLNLEGFIHFRMHEYTHLINLVLYVAIKKSITK